MKTKTIGLIALVVASLSLSGLSQTPVFLSGTATPAANVADAQAHLTDPLYAQQAATILLIQNAINFPGVAAFATSIISDPSLGGIVSGTSDQRYLLKGALRTASSLNTGTANALLDTYASDSELVKYIRLGRDWNSLRQQPTDPAAAISYYDNMKGNFWATPDWVAFINVLPFRLECARQTHATDALGWAKVLYFVTPFADSQKGIGAVATGLRIKDQNLVRSAAFIQFNKDGNGTNILDSIPNPAQFTGITVYSPVLQYLLAGDKVNALKTAFAQFTAAPDTDSLNAGVALVAQTLRNVDGNLVRANAFVNAQKAGTNYTISELAQ